MDFSRAYPKISTWSLLNDGRLKIERTDVQNHIEEWDVFVVDSALQAGKTMFNPGDLVTYRCRENGDDFNVATTFRHLQRLP
jgi:hypothetical protein